MYVNLGKVMLQRHQLLAAFDADKEKYAPFEDILRAAQVSSPYAALSYRQLKTSSHSNSPLMQEALVLPPWVALAIRPWPGVGLQSGECELAVEELSVSEYLAFKEQLVNGQ
jgi:sucrose synthase